MKRNVVLKSFFIVFLLIVFCSTLNITSAATLKFKDTIYRFHDISWSANNNILTTIMWMDKDVCYCLDYARAVSKKSSSYKPINKSVPAKLQYVVMNGYPLKDLGLGNDDMNYAATQLAVWYFSDTNNGVKFNLNNLRANSGYSNYANKTISKARELIAAANKNGNSYTAPLSSISVDSSNASKKISGNYILIGPYKATVKNGNVSSIKVQFSGTVPKSAQIVDKNGNAKSSFSNAEAVYVKINASETKGSAKLKFTASSKSYVATVYSTCEGPYTIGINGKKVYYQDQLVMKPTTKSLSKSVSFSWEPSTGQIRVIKKGDDGKALANVKFALYNSKNKLVSTKLTNSEGVIVFSNLVPGSYYLVEKSTVSGYILDSKKINVTVKANKDVETKVTNKRISAALKIIKVDDIDGSPIQNAVFEILNSKSKVIQTITTDKNGVATSENLKYGTYYYREKSVPNGFELDKKKYKFSINSDKVIEKKVVNKVKPGSIEINKIDGDTKKPIKGAKFEVYDDKGKVIAKLTTNSKGVASIKNLKVGAYSIKEVKAPSGYELDTKTYDLTLTRLNLNIKKTIYNYKETEGTITINKLDGDTKKPIKNAKFELFNSSGKKVATLKTDSKGIATVKKLKLGKYILKEVSVPKGYQVLVEPYYFTLTKSNNNIEQTIYNYKEKEGTITVKKLDGDTKKPIKGVKFDVFDSNNKKVGTITTDAQGLAKIQNLKLGNYTVKETEAPKGYKLNNEEYELTISITNIDVIKTVYNYKEEEKTGSLKIIKVDGDTNAPIQGVKFELYDASNNLLSTLVTDEQGIITVEKLPLGKYYYKEIYAPGNYIVDSTKKEFSLSENNLVYEVTVKNNILQEEETSGSFKIIKIDGDTNAPIEGVKFELYDVNNNLVDTLLTDSAGIIYVEKLPLGDYYYKETEAPGDYVVDNTLKKFSVDKNNISYEVTLKNYEKVEEFGSLEVLKVGDISDEPLQGVKFELYNANGDVIGTLITGADGKAKCSNLPVGSYTLKEVETVEGYTMTTEYVDFEITPESLDVSLKVVNMKDRLVQTGDFFSTDMLIVLSVSVICTVVFFILKRGSLA